jgi:hypothetical protein
METSEDQNCFEDTLTRYLKKKLRKPEEKQPDIPQYSLIKYFLYDKRYNLFV